MMLHVHVYVRMKLKHANIFYYVFGCCLDFVQQSCNTNLSNTKHYRAKTIKTTHAAYRTCLQEVTHQSRCPTNRLPQSVLFDRRTLTRHVYSPVRRRQ